MNISGKIAALSAVIRGFFLHSRRETSTDSTRNNLGSNDKNPRLESLDDESLTMGLATLERILLWMLPVLLVGIIFNAIRFATFGGSWATFVQYTVFLAFLVTILLRRRLKPIIRISIYCGVSIRYGLMGLLEWGLIGQGFIIIIFAHILAVVYSFKLWAITIVISTIISIIIANAFISGRLPLPSNLEEILRSQIVWMTAISTYAIISSTALLWRQLVQKLKGYIRKLHDSERQFRDLFDASSDSIFIHDAGTGEIIDVNQTMLNTYGWTREEIGGLTVLDVSADGPNYSQEKVLDWLDQAARRGMVVFEWLGKRKDGSLFPVEIVLKKSEIAGEARILASTRDITNRKRIEEELIRTFEAVPDMMWLVDANYIVRRINKEMAARLGMPPDEVEGKHCYELIHGKDCPPEFCLHKHLFSDRSKHGVEFFEKHLDSWLSASMSPLWNSDGSLFGSVHVVRDITKQKQDETALRTSEEQYRTFFENSHDAFMTVGPPLWRFLSANPAMVKMFRADDQTRITEASVWDISPRQQPNGRASIDMAREMIEKAMQNGSIFFEWQHKRFDGEEFPASVLLSRLKVQDRTILQATIRDLTETKRLERLLIHAQKMEALGTLAGGITHDFNNILAAILGNTELALRDALPESQLANRLDAILHAVERARKLVAQILAFSRKTELIQEPVRVDLILEEAISLLRPALPSTINIRTDIESPAVIIGDATGIHQVIMNLCTNAYHSMKERGGILDIGLSKVDGDESTPEISSGPYLKLVVQDTGYGIHPALLDRIFDPYFTTKEKGQGTGLGLASAHGIIKRHNGTISAKSSINNGSTFTVYLPAAKDVELIPIDTGFNFQTGCERIMLVDDEAAILEVMEEMLEIMGYSVEGFTDPLQSLESFNLAPDRFDLLITDLTMMGITGDLLISKVRKLRPDMAAILCTGYSDLLENSRRLELGIDVILQKPVAMNVLSLAIREALAKEKNERPLPA
ncbi:MAG: PAS domain S-box protein [Deltaproteobacteria bacterium]|nr:PAS domain S-box protein [Deltaproteobacteria bacterium]